MVTSVHCKNYGHIQADSKKYSANDARQSTEIYPRESESKLVCFDCGFARYVQFNSTHCRQIMHSSAVEMQWTKLLDLLMVETDHTTLIRSQIMLRCWRSTRPCFCGHWCKVYNGHCLYRHFISSGIPLIVHTKSRVALLGVEFIVTSILTINNPCMTYYFAEYPDQHRNLFYWKN